MKKLITIIVTGLITTCLFAQAPQKISYQAVIRNSNGQLITNHTVGMRVSILKGSATGTAVYVETQTPTTDANGLATIEIGGGTVVTGTFEGIDWSNGTYFIKTETDPTGGTSYTVTGTNQMLSVPYAMYAKKAESVDEIMNTLYDQGLLKPKDADGNIYNVVKIGNQRWFQENLRTTRYLNGDLIGTTKPPILDISGEETPKYQWDYAVLEGYPATFGRLYTWYAATDSRNICPTGWHIPSDTEWATLENYLIANGFNYDGTTTGDKTAKSLASKTNWTASTNTGAPGNLDYAAQRNITGFTALPAGYRTPTGTFGYLGDEGHWWFSTWQIKAENNNTCILYNLSYTREQKSNLRYGYSIRCIRDQQAP